MRQNYTIYIFILFSGGIKYQCYLKVNMVQIPLPKKQNP